MNSFFYKVNEEEYLVNITHKRVKNIHYRFKNNQFYVSCSLLTPKYMIEKGLDRFGEKLIKASTKPSPIGDDFIYLFGEKYPIGEKGTLRISNYPEIKYKSREDLLKKLRPIFKEILKERVKYYESLMKLPSYNVTVRKMTSRYGSNSKRTKTLCFALVLIHHSMPIIDSVVVHELAHIKVFNHSKQFYDVVYQYCPNYKECHTKLRKGEFK